MGELNLKKAKRAKRRAAENHAVTMALDKMDAAAPSNRRHHHQSTQTGIAAAASSLSPSPSPFSVRIERDELERLLLLPSHPPPTPPPPQILLASTTIPTTMMPESTATNATFVPTAVPIDDVAFSANRNDDDVAVVAIATSMMPGDTASLPFHPPPHAAAAAASTTRTVLHGNIVSTTTPLSINNNTALSPTMRSNPKAQSDYDDDANVDVVVVPEMTISYTPNNIMPTNNATMPIISQSPITIIPPRTNLRAANVMGTISSEYEIADVARAQRQVRQVLQGQSELAVQLANAKAAQQQEDEGGVAVDGRVVVHYEYCENNLEERKSAQPSISRGADAHDEEVEEEDVTPYGNANHNGKRGGGYEVRQYDVTEYDTKGHEYEVSEYKSVYD